MSSEWRELDDFPDYVMNERGDVKNTLNGKVVRPRSNGDGFHLVWVRNGDRKFVGRGVKKLYRQTFPDRENLDF